MKWGEKVPYQTIGDLPEGIRNALPAAAQEIWLAAYNSADAQGEDMQSRSRIAWAAVSNAGWEKEGETWVKKEDEINLSGFFHSAKELLPGWILDKLQRAAGRKKQVTPGDVHIQAPFEIDLDELDTQIGKGQDKRPKAADIDSIQKHLTASFIKADDEQQIVTGVVLEPETVDAQGDIISAEEIEKAAHKFLAKSRVVGEKHKSQAQAEVVESYIAPQDITIGDQAVKAGTWILSVKVHDGNLWEEVKRGEITGFSIGAIGMREKVA